MHKITRRFLFFLPVFLLSILVKAQDSLRNQKPQMADAMRSNGKIYVVVVVLLIILTGLFIYLIQLDRKISRLEKNK
jgi:CcmD family protein